MADRRLLSEAAPALCHYVVGFESTVLLPWMVIPAIDVFLQGILCVGMGIEQMVDMAFGRNRAVMSRTGIVIGKRSASSLATPSWTVTYNCVANRNIFGLSPPRCRDCTVPVDVQFRDQKRGMYAACSLCRLRTHWYTLPQEALIKGIPGLYRWRWPLTEQQWRWVESGSRHVERQVLRW